MFKDRVQVVSYDGLFIASGYDPLLVSWIKAGQCISDD